jgi:signal transduction histidine kinase
MLDPHKLRFRASAHLQRLIGRELFRSDDLAVLELVKNAYDSGASQVDIVIQPETDRLPGEIVIRDNGSGMTAQRFSDTFMFAGFSIRPSEVGKTPRVPTGEKGIGRFASDRLGAALCVTTKTSADGDPLIVEIDWTAFEDRKKEFNDVTVPYHYAKSRDLLGSTGTTLRITKLRQEWNRRQGEALRRTLGDLLNPFERPKNFSIDLTIQGSDILSGVVVQAPITEQDLELRIKVEKSGNVSRRIRGSEHAHASDGEWVQITRAAKGLEGVTARLLYFYKRPNREQSAGLEAGVRVYRDGFRIEPFGSSSADWLGIAEKRAKRAGHAHIVPTRLFGFVSLSRVKNKTLIDTTSREALIDNEDSRALIALLKSQLDILEEIIQSDEAEPRWEENRVRDKAQLEEGRLQALSLMSSGLAHELRQPLQVLSLEVGNIATRLHQLGIDDASIIESQQAIEEGVSRIDQNIRTIASLTTGDMEANVALDLAELVRDTCLFIESRCTNAGVKLVVETPHEQSAHLNGKLVQMVLLNLIQNAIDALQNLPAPRSKEIVVRLDHAFLRHRLVVEDNADGIPEERRPHIFKRFNTGKTGGMGLGLFLCNSMLTAAKGEISFSTALGSGSTFTVLIGDSDD